MRPPYRWILILLLGVVLLTGLGIVAYNLPPIHERVAWRVDDALTRIHNFFNPPERTVFVPQGQEDAQIATIVAATMQALTPTPTTPCIGSTCATPTPPCAVDGCQTPTVETPATSTPTTLPTLTPTAIPAQALLKGIIHEYQKMNNCGPTNLAMALSFWGWKGDQMVTASYLRPGFNPGAADNKDDKNVMPYEMVNFVQEKTEFSIVERTGGDLALLKNFVAAGFPVLIEKGFEGIQFEGWMGHYEVVNGYDDGQSEFTVQDSYNGPDQKVTYASMESNWRAFNYVYMVIYPPDHEAQVVSILGPQADLAYNQAYTAQKAAAEISQLSGRDQFFALYNRGSSLVAQQDYSGAATAYDQAYQLYPSIPEAKRPWRMTWYQTGPYFAYYYTARYNDVINLATQTLESTTLPGLEESWVWRGRAENAIGDTTDAISDFRSALLWHPNFQPALDDLAQLGVSP